MEFLDEETRPRFLFHSRSSPSIHPDESQPSDRLLKPSHFMSLSLSTLLFSITIFLTHPEPLNSLLLWISFSLLLGPFAPSSLTAGNIRVGVGKLLPNPLPVSFETEKTLFPNRRSKNRKFEENLVPQYGQLPENVPNLGKLDKIQEKPVQEREWSEGDLEMLKKLLVKNPVGKLKRWEAISEAFGGAHGVESVIKMAKMLGEKRLGDSDSFAKFLKDRKPLDRRVEEAEEAGEKEGGWSGGDDVALLNALKAFPKETAMRWEKIAAAVPGKTKAACVKRVAELKKGFRSSKMSGNDHMVQFSDAEQKLAVGLKFIYGAVNFEEKTVIQSKTLMEV